MRNRLHLMIIAVLLAGLQLSLTSDSSKKTFKVVKERKSALYSPIPTYMEFEEGSRPSVAQLSSIFDNYIESDDFGFKELKVEEDYIGYKHYRYQQTYKGIPIEFTRLYAHTKSGRIISVNGEIIASSPIVADEAQQIKEENALEYAKDHIGSEVYKWELSGEEEHLKWETNDPTATYYPKGELVYIAENAKLSAKEMRLAFRFNIYSHQPLSRYQIYVDAQDGKILFNHSLIHTGNSEGTAVTAYSGTHDINTDSVSATEFRLRQTVSGNGIRTFNMLRGTNRGNAVDFTDSDNHWNNVNADLDEYATDAHWGTEVTYDYFKTKFNRNSIDDLGFQLNSYVHFAQNFINAFWDGFRMTYGDGNGFFTPFTALDITGHEITHGLTDKTADLVFQRESGALNESFSDIFGASVEFFGRPTNANWTIGEDTKGTFRSMFRPKTFNDPDTYKGQNWRTADETCIPSQQNNNCGVHTNSGVQNFWFYLVVNGGIGTNDNNEVYNVTGIGMDTAAAIAYRNLVVYLSPLSGFEDSRFYSIQSALDLYGPCSKAVQAVTDAWHAVGVGAKYVPGVISDFETADSVACEAPLLVRFNNLSNNALGFSWDFGDGGTDTNRNPTHVYLQEGEYDVELIVDGGTCGVDTLKKSKLIKIDSDMLCRVRMEQGINPTQTDCEGKLLDNGGLGEDYDNNLSSVITIAPTGASSVTLTINSLDIRGGNAGVTCDDDVLEIFDGSTVDAPSLGAFCSGSTIPSTITSRFGAVTLRFTSDFAITDAGFDIDWACEFPTTVPSVDFLTSSETSCTGEINFRDYSTNNPTSWSWDFGDGTTSTEQNPTHFYTTNGTYDVQLTATNSFGSANIVKNSLITINRPQKPTVQDDMICRHDDATLTASTVNSGILRWFDAEFEGNEVHTGSSFQVDVVNETISFWVEELVDAQPQFVGPADSSIGQGANFDGEEGLVFDVFERIELVSVLVFSNGTKSRNFILRDKNGVLIESVTRFIPSGENRIPLGIEIEPGDGYELTVTASGGVDLHYNFTGVNYPYVISGVVSINESTSSLSPTGLYYSAYDWEVKSADCISPRAEVTVVVDPTCVVGIEDIDLLSERIKTYPNPVKEKLTIELPVTLEKVDQVSLTTISGQVVFNQRQFINNESSLNIDLPGISNGVYFLRILAKDKFVTKKVIVSK